MDRGDIYRISSISDALNHATYNRFHRWRGDIDGHCSTAQVDSQRPVTVRGTVLVEDLLERNSALTAEIVRRRSKPY
jgi:hypothetical protein